MKSTIICAMAVACAALTFASAGQAATYTALETNFRNDGSTGRFDLPAGVTEGTADFTIDAFTPGVPIDVSTPITGGAGFGAGDELSVYGAMLGHDDNILFTVTTDFVLTIDFLSDNSSDNTPVWRLFSGSSIAGTPVDSASFTEVVAGSPENPFGTLAAGTYVLQIDGDDSVQGAGNNFVEAYDFRITAVPLPATALLLLMGLAALAGLRRRS